MKNISNYKIFLSVFAILVLSNLLHHVLGYNEETLLVLAKSFSNTDWIANDFALSTSSDYQLLYNYFAGFLAQFLPLTSIAIIGRLVVYFFFSIGLHCLNKLLKLPWYLFALAIFLFIGNQSVIAGEWMVKGFEFKSLAYAAIFIGLYFWTENKKWISLIFLGLAVSFHVLIGCYAFIALIIATLLSRDMDNSTWKSLPLFFLFGLVGWYAVYQFMTKGSGSLSTDELIKYYVQFRVSHHVYPATWSSASFILLIVFTLLNVLCYRYVIRSKKTKFFYHFAFAHLLFFLIGMFFYAIGDLAKLKYYWFRTADVFTSLLFYISIFILIKYLFEKLRSSTFKWKSYPKRITKLALAILMIFLIQGFSEDFYRIKKSENLSFVDNRFPYLNQAFFWIKENTAAHEGVISSPYDEFYYVMAERRAFVNFKTGPADLSLLSEWYNRIKILNNGKDIDFDSPFYGQWQTFENNFNEISEDQWIELADSYDFHYLLCKAWVKKDFNIAYQNEAFILYKIR